MRKTSFDMSDDLYRKANIASAACGLSAAGFYRAVIASAIQTMADHDPALAAAFEMPTRELELA